MTNNLFQKAQASVWGSRAGEEEDYSTNYKDTQRKSHRIKGYRAQEQLKDYTDKIDGNPGLKGVTR